MIPFVLPEWSIYSLMPSIKVDKSSTSKQVLTQDMKNNLATIIEVDGVHQ